MSPIADPLAELAALLRPAGGGLFVVSTGRAEQLAVQRAIYGVDTEAEVEAAHAAALGQIAGARAIILGVPSDVGAGFRRGANLGPQGIRAALAHADPTWRTWLAAHRIVDIGDVFVVPQLLHDDMLAPAQIAATRRAIYHGDSFGGRDVDATLAATLPVSPLSIEERVLACVFAINPAVVPIVLGGDHSIAWPVSAALAARPGGERWGIVQPDAHTDLLAERLGVKYCFATWSYHANELLGRDGRLVQVGIRASRRDRAHWESTLGVRQFWAADIARDPTRAIDEVIAHLRAKGVERVYFSNDIDGTDSAFASATGTPEPDGVSPEWLLALIARLGAEFGFCAVDCVEVAPPLGPTAAATETTCALAATYIRACLDTIVK